MVDNLYSFIASRDSEVFTAQIHAADLTEACLAWGDHFGDDFQQKGFDKEEFLGDVAFKMEMLPPVLINGTENFWCFSFLVNKKVMWVHIVQTAATARQPKGQYAHTDKLPVPNQRY